MKFGHAESCPYRPLHPIRTRNQHACSQAFRFKGAVLAHQLVHIDAVLLILSYKGRPVSNRAAAPRAKPIPQGRALSLILKHEAVRSTSNRETATCIPRAKGRDAALIKPFMDNIKRLRDAGDGVRGAKKWAKRTQAQPSKKYTGN
ncbi:hypothetical protein MPLA_1620044 [Mesorhizobium sp. ORS 3359]|uniref:hypothetical protein n=1 Tax=Mesorhizobium sp. LCM 4576 TaxID=1848289 RepID=UPI000507713D|nr:hypothetical protein [Mesorhizobium sp. LCM 4576]CDX33054.1 hypothetical protein MPLA_1620044 [Mesorhizobium sp. ORS 3359]